MNSYIAQIEQERKSSITWSKVSNLPGTVVKLTRIRRKERRKLQKKEAGRRVLEISTNGIVKKLSVELKIDSM